MDKIWKANDQVDAEEDLTVTEHRDEDAVPSEEFYEEGEIRPLAENVQEALEHDGEDVASSPARRAQETPGDQKAAGDQE